MKLLKRITLLDPEGDNAQVCHIDLCQIDRGRYVINYHYGQKGSNLKSATKTPEAIPFPQAQQIFSDIISFLKNKGYRDAPHQAILNRLLNNQPTKWKLERAIWRAGELKIREATPLLINLLGTAEPLRDYCIAWALGWCGGDDAITALKNIYQNPSTPEFVQRIAFEALLKLADRQTKTTLIAQKIESLPSQLRHLAQNDSQNQFAIALKAYLQNSDRENYAILDTIYQIDNEHTRPALLDILRNAPFRANYFQRLRHIFKMAEYRRDAEVFAIFVYRLDKEQPMFSRKKNSVKLSNGQTLIQRFKFNPFTNTYEATKNEVTEELKRPDSALAYSNKTREYLRRRIWRTLKELGQEADPDYIKIAVSILLQYSDENAKSVKESLFYRYRPPEANDNPQRERVRIELKCIWDKYAGYLVLAYLVC